MRILLVNAHGADLAYGGAERYVHDLREGLAQTGVGCSVLSAFPGLDDRSPELHVVYRTDWRTDPARRARAHARSWLAPVGGPASRVLGRLAPDVLHTHNLGGVSTGIWEAARRAGIPVVHTIHDYQLLCPRATLLRRDGTPCRRHPLLCGLRTRRLARWGSGVIEVIGVSAHVLAVHRGVFPASTGEHVIHVPRPEWSGPPPSRPSSLRVLGYTGALSASKGVALLLAAAPRLREQGVVVRIAGDGPLRADVAAASAVDYVGRLSGERLGGFRLSCDAGIVPSLWQEPGITFSASEWLAAGRPVLATARGGLGELPDAGVARIRGTAEDLLAQVTQLREAAAWRRLVGAIPPASPGAVRRWIDAHRGVYERALDRGPV